MDWQTRGVKSSSVVPRLGIDLNPVVLYPPPGVISVLHPRGENLRECDLKLEKLPISHRENCSVVFEQ